MPMRSPLQTPALAAEAPLPPPGQLLQNKLAISVFSRVCRVMGPTLAVRPPF
jgi:hypothetical protein